MPPHHGACQRSILRSRVVIGYDIRLRRPSATAVPSGQHFGSCRKPTPNSCAPIYFGMFAFLAVPLLSALNWITGSSATTAGRSRPHHHHQRGHVPLRHRLRLKCPDAEIQPQVKLDSGSTQIETTSAKQKMNTELMGSPGEGREPGGGCIDTLTMPSAVLQFVVGIVGCALHRSFSGKDLRSPIRTSPNLMGISQLVQQGMTAIGGHPCSRK